MYLGLSMNIVVVIKKIKKNMRGEQTHKWELKKDEISKFCEDISSTPLEI